MRTRAEPDSETWAYGPRGWTALATAAALAVLAFYDGIAPMVGAWSSEEYSHGTLVPLVAAYLVWQRAPQLGALPFDGSWPGVGIVAAGLLLGIAGELSAIYTLMQYGFLLVIWGTLLAFMGPRPYALIAVPVAVLFFVVPLPAYLYNGLSQQLQLWSSELGVWFIRLFGISVFLEGNVIDLGSMRLQVVEACSGLRYLFPLTALAFIAAYLFRAPLWQRVLVFVSAAPLTLVMNSFRIGVIGYLVDRHGRSMAEGFLHDFEGWLVFMACFALLLLEMRLLMLVTGDRRAFGEAFGIEPPSRRPAATTRSRRLPAQAYVALALLLPALVLATLVDERVETPLARQAFSAFPSTLGDWNGTAATLGDAYVRALRLDDYLLADYVAPDAGRVNLYAAWYASQRKGQSAHSPRSCMPGGGWRIESLARHAVPGVSHGGGPLNVARAVISMGDTRQLVYYWFQQRGRIVTNEYLVKWYIFQDSLTRNRSDGALVRLVTPVDPRAGLEVADRRLAAFAALALPALAGHIPE